jgi:hypothetical protein
VAAVRFLIAINSRLEYTRELEIIGSNYIYYSIDINTKLKEA